MSEHLNSEEEDLLQSALSTAFSPAPLPRQSATLEPEPVSAPEPVAAPEPASEPQLEPSAAAGEVKSTEDAWKEEYEAHVAEWRKRSAEQRQKAEEERAKWEAIRAKEREEGKGPESVFSLREQGWENLSSSVTTAATAAESPSPADARDLVTGEAQGGHSKEYLETVLPGAQASTSISPPENEHSQPASEPESSKQEKWDEMTSSLTSSFPSMSFPSDPHSPSSSARRDLAPAPLHHHHHHSEGHAHGPGHLHAHHHPHHHHEGPEGAKTATLSVFDASLSPKTRALALLSSIAINVLLPFVNGVMLGFGEIFAKNIVVRWIGWRVPGTASSASAQGSGRVATNVGLGRK
ncbi:hypothetical protein C8Q73DRAFT_633551 [Cubamyces lactineus]|nr:hypothetical protein C8Q73DRAFT_633551 [Cubamyces lactineus]